MQEQSRNCNEINSTQKTDWKILLQLFERLSPFGILGAQLKASLKPVGTIVLWCWKDFRGYPYWKKQLYKKKNEVFLKSKRPFLCIKKKRCSQLCTQFCREGPGSTVDRCSSSSLEMQTEFRSIFYFNSSIILRYIFQFFYFNFNFFWFNLFRSIYRYIQNPRIHIIFPKTLYVYNFSKNPVYINNFFFQNPVCI